MNYGFVRVGIGKPQVKVGNPSYNCAQIQRQIEDAQDKQVDILLFPELSLSAYSCRDLFFQKSLLDSCQRELSKLISFSKGKRPLCLVGLPFAEAGKVYNVAAVFCNGALLGMVPKTYLPTEENRWFSPGTEVKIKEVEWEGKQIPFGTDLLFFPKEFPTCTIGVEIGTDLKAQLPPSAIQSAAGATVLCNLAADTQEIGKTDRRRQLVKSQASRHLAVYAYAGGGMGETTTDGVYAGHGMVFLGENMALETLPLTKEDSLAFCDVDIEQVEACQRKNGAFGALPQGVCREFRLVSFGQNLLKRPLVADITKVPFLPKGEPQVYFEEILNIQAQALEKRFLSSGIEKAVLGLSGGLDSALALLSLCHTFDQMGKERGEIIAVTMPGFGTTKQSLNSAKECGRALGVDFREISIIESVNLHFKDIGHDPKIEDITYENAQARERTQILMDLANKENGLVIGTGNLSELALGFSTFGGDHLSMYAINAGVPKTILRDMVAWLWEIELFPGTKKALEQMLKAPISPELLPSDASETKQKTEEIIGPYVLHDFFLYYTLSYGFTREKIEYLAVHAFEGTFDKASVQQWSQVFFSRFYKQQFKRNCLPDGPKVCALSLSPRGGLFLPSDVEWD